MRADEIRRLGTERWRFVCERCGWESPEVSDRATAVQVSDVHYADPKLRLAEVLS